jgi:hypothetical protein
MDLRFTSSSILSLVKSRHKSQRYLQLESSPLPTLITAYGFGASWNSDAASTPWSLYVTASGRAVSDGGAYPDEDSEAHLLLSGLRMEDALLLCDRLAKVLAGIGIPCETQAIGDG